MKKFIFSGLFIFICFSTFSVVENGVVTFEKNVLAKKVVSLRGKWELYTNKMIATNYDGQYDVDTYIDVPASWNSTLRKQNVPIQSTNSYRVLINSLDAQQKYGIYIKDSPGTSCNIFCNGELILSAGVVDFDLERATPKSKPLYVLMSPNDDGQIELVIQVSNSYFRRGGLWDDVRFGLGENVYREFALLTGLTFFIIGAILILAFVYFSIFLFDHSRKAEWMFSWTLFVIVIRIGTAEFSMLGLYFDQWSFEMQYKLEYFTVWFAPICFVLFYLQYVKNDKILALISRIIIMATASLGVVVTFLPIRYGNYLVDLMMFFGMLSLFFILVCSIIDMTRKKIYGYITFIDLLILLCGFIPDLLLVYRRDLFPMTLTPYAVLVFSFFQFICISVGQSKLYNKQKSLVADLQLVNDACAKYVPKEFLHILQVCQNAEPQPKSDSLISADMTIVYAQVYFRDDKDNPNDDKIEVASRFLRNVCTNIVANKGFVIKFIATGFIALFPKNSADAINCCREIIAMLNHINDERVQQKMSPLEIGMGIHYDKMLLATDNVQNKLDECTISDAIEIASSIESFAKNRKLAVVVSENVVKHTQNETFRYSSIGEIKIKGDQSSLVLSEFNIEESL